MIVHLPCQRHAYRPSELHCLDVLANSFSVSCLQAFEPISDWLPARFEPKEPHAKWTIPDHHKIVPKMVRISICGSPGTTQLTSRSGTKSSVHPQAQCPNNEPYCRSSNDRVEVAPLSGSLSFGKSPSPWCVGANAVRIRSHPDQAVVCSALDDTRLLSCGDVVSSTVSALE